MTNRAQYLDTLKEELSQYKDQLAKIKKDFGKEVGKDMEKIYPPLHDIFQQTSKAYDKLTSASADEWEPLKKEVGVLFDKLKTSVEDVAHSASTQTKEYAKELQQHYKEELENFGDYISKNPFKSMMWSVGLGLLVGRLTK